MMSSSRLDEIAYMAGTVANPGVHLLALVVSINFLKPAELGILSTCALVPAYLSFAHLGVFTGLARQVPFSLGRGDEASAASLEAASEGLAWIQGILLALILLVAGGIWWLVDGFSLGPAALAATGMFVMNNTLAAHVDVALRGRDQFKRLAQVLWLNHALNVGSVALICRYGAWGVVARLVLSGLGGVAIRMALGAVRFRWGFAWAPWRELCRVGFPLMLSGAMFNLLVVSDRSVVAIMLDSEAVGIFALSGMILQGLQVLPQSLSMILFPKMAREFGRSQDPRRLRSFILKNLAFNCLTLLPLCALIYLGLPPLVERFLPGYRDGIEPARIACISACFWVYLGTGSVFGVTGQMRPYLAVLAGAIVVVWSLGALLIRLDFGLIGASWARFVGTGIIAVATVLMALTLTSRGKAPDGGGSR